MGVKICLIAPIASASGNAVAKDQHGHEVGTIGFRKRQASGNQFLQVGKAAPRDLEKKPLSSDEQQSRSVFSMRAAQKKIILADDDLREQYFAQYQSAVQAGAVKTYALTGKPMSFNCWLMTIRVDSSILGA